MNTTQLEDWVAEGRRERAMAVLETIRERRSCRLFQEDPIPRELVELILDAANHAPSPMNTQPWEFIVLAGQPLAEYRDAVSGWLKEPRKREPAPDEAALRPDGESYLKTSLPKHLTERKKRHIRYLSDRLAESGIALKDVYHLTYLCHNAPVVVMVAGDAVKRDKAGLEIHQALAAAMQNMLLAAEALGLGACWIGDIMFFGRRPAEHLVLSEAKEIVGAIAVGRPFAESDIPKVPKDALTDKVDWRGM